MAEDQQIAYDYNNYGYSAIKRNGHGSKAAMLTDDKQLLAHIKNKHDLSPYLQIVLSELGHEFA